MRLRETRMFLQQELLHLTEVCKQAGLEWRDEQGKKYIAGLILPVVSKGNELVKETGVFERRLGMLLDAGWLKEGDWDGRGH